MSENKFSQPEILYQEHTEGVSNGIPFVKVNSASDIPKVLFIASAIDSDEKNEEGETIVDFIVTSYYESSFLRKVLSDEQMTELRSLMIKKQ